MPTKWTNLILAALIFVALFFLANQYVQSAYSLIFGTTVMIFTSSSIIMSVKCLFSESYQIFGVLILLIKTPITLLLLYFFLKSDHYDIFSFAIGVLILLPSLVILSYRKA